MQKRCKNFSSFEHFQKLRFRKGQMLLHSIKGQITIFMILGIILLFSTALIFYIKGKAQIAEEEKMPSLQEIPDMAKPVRQYVEGCANQKLADGIKKAMEHGGMVYTDALKVDAMDPTEGEGIETFPNSNDTIPYWFYMKSKNDCASACRMATAKPPLCKPGRIGCIETGENSVEEQLQIYLEKEMKSCIRNFEDIKKQGYQITELNNLTATVTIRQKDAVALINYELEIQKDEAWQVEQ